MAWGHNDTECKISAFGDKFVFVMAGLVKGPGWDAHAVAREVWQNESKSIPDATQIVQSVSQEWAKRMEEIYKRPEVISGIRDHATREQVLTNTVVLTNAVFSATDKTGALVVHGMNITYSLDILGTVSHDEIDVQPNSWISGGRDEIINEFLNRTSLRADQYMAEFVEQIRSLPPSDRRAALASKLLEWSIQLHPNNSELAFPIDVLQLRRTTGVHWISLKPSCPQK